MELPGGEIVYRFSPRDIKRVMREVRQELRLEGIDLRDHAVRRTMGQVRAELARATCRLRFVTVCGRDR